MLGIVVSLPWELKSLTRQAIPAGTWKAITEDTLVALSGIGAERAYAAFEKPLIAMIRGFCMGGGLLTAMKADLRIAADDSQFGIPAVYASPSRRRASSAARAAISAPVSSTPCTVLATRRTSSGST